MIDRRAFAALIPVLFLGGIASAQDDPPEPPPAVSVTAPARETAPPATMREVTPSGNPILVELFTSQGCNYCPNAERLLQLMAARGYGRARVISLAFHVDYFNQPWADPFSEKLYSRRQWAYHDVFKTRDATSPDLYFTPMIMVDGRFPMTGYHADGTAPLWPLLKARLDRASKTRREASLTVRLESAPDRPRQRSVTILATAKTARPADRAMLACVAVAEGPLSTAVPSGENAGETLIEHHVVRAFRFESITLGRGDATEAAFTLDLPEGADPSTCEIVAFLQDEKTGAIARVATLSWDDRAPGAR